jgi:hypothetical protein
MQRKYVNSLAKLLSIQNTEDWYKVTLSMVRSVTKTPKFFTLMDIMQMVRFFNLKNNLFRLIIFFLSI